MIYLLLKVCQLNILNEEKDNVLMRSFPKRQKCRNFMMCHKYELNMLTMLSIGEGVLFQAVNIIGFARDNSLLFLLSCMLINWVMSFYFQKIYELNVNSTVLLCISIGIKLIASMIVDSSHVVSMLMNLLCWAFLIPLIIYAEKAITKYNLSDQTILSMFFVTKLGMHSP